jgi:Family of unknown function (DUF6498)
MARLLFLPALLATLVVDLIPLYGVLAWGWETFQLLMLYWIETVMIAFWSIRRIALLPGEQARRAREKSNPADFGMAGFFTLHAGIFITVHFILLWAFFSYPWFQKVHGIGSFFFQLFIANGVWAALLLMALFHWVSFRTDPLVSGARAGVSPTLVQARDRAAGTGIAPILVGLYTRIIIMQLAIIGGALLSQFTGSLAPLVIVIVLKTVVDLALAAFVPLKALFMSGETTASGH